MFSSYPQSTHEAPGLTAALTAFCLFGVETLAHRQLMLVGYNNQATIALSLAATSPRLVGSWLSTWGRS